MKKIIVPLFCTMLMYALPAHADYSKDECALIKGGEITKGACKSDRFYSKMFDATVIFNKEKYTIWAMECINAKGDICTIATLYKDSDSKKNTDAIEQHRDEKLRLTKDLDSKFVCFKRKKSTKNPYELCITSVSYSGSK